MPKIKNDEYYIKVCEASAERSYAERAKVGAVLVKDGRIISDGYNGTPKGFDNTCEHMVVMYTNTVNDAVSLSDNDNITVDMFPQTQVVTKPEVLHAEANAITKCAKSTESSDGATLYTLLSPCFECAKLIIQSGIIRVVYRDEYHTTTGLDLLREANIKVEQYEQT